MGFAEVLDNLLKERGAAAKLSIEAEVNERLIGFWRKGEKQPTIGNLIKLCEYFEMSADDLLGLENFKTQHIGDVSSTVGGNGIAFAHGVNHGSVIIRHGQEKPLSDEAGELLRIYETLDLKRRLKILDLAVKLEEEQGE